MEQHQWRTADRCETQPCGGNSAERRNWLWRLGQFSDGRSDRQRWLGQCGIEIDDFEWSSGRARENETGKPEAVL
jgi:hypothetical protein